MGSDLKGAFRREIWTSFKVKKISKSSAVAFLVLQKAFEKGTHEYNYFNCSACQATSQIAPCRRILIVGALGNIRDRPFLLKTTFCVFPEKVLRVKWTPLIMFCILISLKEMLFQ